MYDVMCPYYNVMPDDLILDLERLQRYYDAWTEDDEQDEWTEEMEEEWDNLNKVSVSAFNNLSLRVRSCDLICYLFVCLFYFSEQVSCLGHCFNDLDYHSTYLILM